VIEDVDDDEDAWSIFNPDYDIFATKGWFIVVY
jgi:hypothetical protein